MNSDPDFVNFSLADLDNKFVSKLIFVFISPVPKILNLVTFFFINLLSFKNFMSILFEDVIIFL